MVLKSTTLDDIKRSLFQNTSFEAYQENLDYCGITRSHCDSTAFLLYKIIVRSVKDISLCDTVVAYIPICSCGWVSVTATIISRTALAMTTSVWRRDCQQLLKLGFISLNTCTWLYRLCR